MPVSTRYISEVLAGFVQRAFASEFIIGRADDYDAIVFIYCMEGVWDVAGSKVGADKCDPEDIAENYLAYVEDSVIAEEYMHGGGTMFDLVNDDGVTESVHLHPVVDPVSGLQMSALDMLFINLVRESVLALVPQLPEHVRRKDICCRHVEMVDMRMCEFWRYEARDEAG